MAVYDLQEQEQLDELKAYWKQYGNLILTLVTVVLAVIAALQLWNYYQRRQAVEASAVFASLQRVQAAKDTKQIKDLAGTLLEKYPGTYYAAMAALISAKNSYDTGDVKTAKAQLEWVVQNAKPEEFRDLARLRLAGVLLDEKAYDEALKQLEPAGGGVNPAFAGRYADLKGDILAAQKKNAEAKTAYQAALGALDAKSTEYRQYVQEKLDNLGGNP
jgi:predicted negative regulator of RcsB-dependent stress response